MSYFSPTRSAWTGIFAAAITAACGGCGPAGPKTYPVRGSVRVAGADVKLLAGSHVEGVLASDSTIRTAGIIQDDGTFSLETLHQGSALNGAVEGRFHVRILLADDDPTQRRQAARAVAPKYLAFKTSGLTIDIPPSGDVTLEIAGR